MKTTSFSGIGNNNYPQDACVTDGEEAIQDRTTEHLGYGDRPIVASRLLLMKAIADVQAGREPPGVVRDPAANDFSDIGAMGEVVPSPLDWRAYWRQRISPPIEGNGEAKQLDGAGSRTSSPRPVGTG